jgi:hypothetical protein
MEDSNDITNVQFTYANGKSCDYSRRELRAMSQDLDNIAYVKKNGTVASGFVGVLQFPLLGITKMEITKSDQVSVTLLMRVDNLLASLN